MGSLAITPSYYPDPKDPTNSDRLIPQNSPLFAKVNEYYGDVKNYRDIDAAAAKLYMDKYTRYAEAYVKAAWASADKNAPSAILIANLPPVPVPDDAHSVSLDENYNVVIKANGPVVPQQPTPNPNEWMFVRGDGLLERLVRVTQEQHPATSIAQGTDHSNQGNMQPPPAPPSVISNQPTMAQMAQQLQSLAGMLSQMMQMFASMSK